MSEALLEERFGDVREHWPLVETSIDLTRRLRKRHFGELKILGQQLGQVKNKPVVYYGRATNGPVPEDTKGGVDGVVPIVIYQNSICPDTGLGLCGPCGYSSEMVGKGNPVSQNRWLLDNFDTVVKAHQDGIGRDYRLKNRSSGNEFYMIQIAGIGSFLQDSEVSPQQRLQILEMFREFARQNDYLFNISMEAKARDVVKSAETGEFDEFKDRGLISDLNLEVTLGFESVDNFTRQVLYTKGLPLSIFEQALDAAQSYGMDTGAYVFSGGHSMDFDEAKAVVKKSLDYLDSKDCYYVLMLPNIQPLTLPHLLHWTGRYNILDPLQAANLVILLEERKDRSEVPHSIYQHKWHIGPIGAEPTPDLTMYNNPKRLSCDSCARSALDAIDHLAITHDWQRFREVYDLVTAHSCFKPPAPSEKPLPQRTKENLEAASEAAEDYLNSVAVKYEHLDAARYVAEPSEV